MRRFGLIGYPLKTSFSKAYFTEKFEREGIADHQYDLFPLNSIEEFPGLLEKYPDLVGLNVTIPYKKQVIPYLSELDETASGVGAVNVIKIGKDGRLTGSNSDAIGFERSFLPLLKPSHKKALVLGTGGAAAAVAYILKKNGIGFNFVSRTQQADFLTYDTLKEKGFEDYSIIINTTPLGMAPDVNTCPDIPYEKITPDFVCYDLVYTPEETLFLQKSKKQGAVIKNGLEMLHLQADRAWEIWHSDNAN